MLHPVLIVTLRKVLTGMSATRLLTRLCRVHRLGSSAQQVAKLKCLCQVGVPDQAAVLDRDLGELGHHVVNLAHTLLQRVLRTEHGSI